MSNRRKIPPPQPGGRISGMFASLDGARIPGGCDYCDAYQEIQANAYGHGGIHLIRVCHDDWCPELAQRRPPAQPDPGPED